MGDPRLQPTDDPPNMSHPFGQDAAQLTRSGSQEEDELRKGRPGASSQQSTSQLGYSGGHQYQHQQNMLTRPEPFTLGSLGTALPDLPYQNHGQYPSASASSGYIYPIQNSPQFAGAQAINPPNAPHQYQAQYQDIYAAGNPPSGPHLQQGTAVGGQFYHQGYMGLQQQQGTPYFIQPSQYNPNGQMYAGMQQPAQFGARPGFSGDSRNLTQKRPNEYIGGVPPSGGLRGSSSIGEP
jgi:hypothetical protein